MVKALLRGLICAVCLSTPSVTLAQPVQPVRADNTVDASIDLVVANTTEAIQKAEIVFKKFGGKIEKRSMQRDQYDNQSAIFHVTLPSSALDEVMNKLRGLGTVRGENSDFDAAREMVRIKIVIADKRTENYYDARSQGSLFAGVAAARLSLNLSNDKSRSMAGGGISISPRGHWAQLTIIMLKETNKETPTSTSKPEPSSSGSSIVLIAHNFYSSIFGGGYRPFLNPYAGFTYGYSRLFSRSLFAIGGTIGLELVKMPWFTWSVSGNLLGLYSGKDGGTTNMYASHFFIPF